MTPLLEARGLALDGRLEPSELRLEGPQLVALIGPNGSGKTSLLHAIARIGSPAGEARIAGVRPEEVGPAQRKRLLSFLPASRDLAWPVAARDLVRLGLPAGAADEEADKAMAALALEPFATRRADRLSTGERSRVLIARALAPSPRLLLLDEPTANLDPHWQLRLMEMLVEAVRDKGQGVVATLHDLDLAERYAERVMLMNEGRIAADGAPEAVLKSDALQEAFGVRRAAGRWEAISLPADPRSSR